MCNKEQGFYRSSVISEVEQLRAELASKPIIDELMLEYCPDELTPEQIANWSKYQRRLEG